MLDLAVITSDYGGRGPFWARHCQQTLRAARPPAAERRAPQPEAEVYYVHQVVNSLIIPIMKVLQLVWFHNF